MTITAKFDADFSAFAAGTNAAIKDLEAFETAAVDTGDSVVVSVKEMNQALVDMEDPLTGMTTQFSEFDSILKSLGVNIGPQVRAFEELGKMIGLSSSAMALLGPAALVVGTAMAAWKIGTIIAEVTQLDEWVGNMAESLMGWDASAEAAGAEADAIALAFQRTGIEARNGAEALELNTKWMKESGRQATETAAEVNAALDARGKALERFKVWNDDRLRNLEATIKAEEEYQAVQKAETEELNAWADSMARVMMAEGAWLEVVNAMNPALVDRVKNLMAEGVATSDLLRTLEVTPRQLEAIARAREFDNQMLREAKTLKDEIIPVTEDLAATLYEEARAIDAEFEALRRSTEEKRAAAQATRDLTAATAENAIAARQKPLIFTPVPGAQTNQSKLTGVGPNDPFSLFNVVHADVERGRARSPYLNQHIVNVNGIMMSDDPAAKQALAQAISMAMMGSLRGGGQQVGPGR